MVGAEQESLVSNKHNLVLVLIVGTALVIGLNTDRPFSLIDVYLDDGTRVHNYVLEISRKYQFIGAVDSWNTG
ncbi:MAG: hypothetical protein GOU99_03135 [Candidatus Altiarchaeota archaeon]|nr:hypothetical protein [Candidatus Altiarchaeota archaeon]